MDIQILTYPALPGVLQYKLKYIVVSWNFVIHYFSSESQSTQANWVHSCQGNDLKANRITDEKIERKEWDSGNE